MAIKNKFKKDEWQKLKNAVEGYKGEIHHLAGKDYEYLCFLLPLSVKEHRGNNPIRNYGDPDKVPLELKIKAITFWTSKLSDEDFNYFFDNGLINYSKGGDLG